MSESIVQFNETALKGELKDLVRSSVEETLNALLDQGAGELAEARNGFALQRNVGCS